MVKTTVFFFFFSEKFFVFQQKTFVLVGTKKCVNTCEYQCFCVSSEIKVDYNVSIFNFFLQY